MLFRSRLRDLEERREGLHAELTGLNTQADVRAKLQLKRTETKRKDEAIQSLCVFRYSFVRGN